MLMYSSVPTGAPMMTVPSVAMALFLSTALSLSVGGPPLSRRVHLLMHPVSSLTSRLKTSMWSRSRSA